MTKYFAYSLTVWLRILPKQQPVGPLGKAVMEHLASAYAIDEFQPVEDFDCAPQYTFSFQLTWTFTNEEMYRGEPRKASINALVKELRKYVAAEYVVKHIEILDDAPTTYLLEEWDE